MNVQTLAEIVFNANNDRLDGRITRNDHATVILFAQQEMDYIGASWADMNDAIAALIRKGVTA